MPECRITLRSGDTVDVQGDLQAVTEELHRVATRREHTFAVLQEPSGRNIALPPDSVLYVRPLDPDDGDLSPQ